MLIDMFNARQLELAAAERTIAQRMELDQITRVERLERALRSARERLAVFGYSRPAKA